jgi:hypothetical protein
VLYFDFVGDFLDSCRAHAIGQLHHLAVERFSSALTKTLDWDSPYEAQETRIVTVSHHFLIEVDEAIGIHKQTEGSLSDRASAKAESALPSLAGSRECPSCAPGSGSPS